MYTTIISTEALFDHLNHRDFIIIDCRHDLMKPEWGYQDYQRAHIPGSVFADLNQDLAGPITTLSGRHPLPEPDWFVKVMSRLGVDHNKQVVVVDHLAGAFAARLWWMLRIYGHQAVAVLEGGLAQWEYKKYPLQSGIEQKAPSQFVGNPQTEMYFTTKQMEGIISDPTYRVIDARAGARYRGETEPIDPVAGHIPGAVNRFHTDNLFHGGLFKAPETLRKEFLDLLDGTPPENTIVYCGSGVTSCFHLLAMEIAGLPGAKLYPGSWSEWIRDPLHPIVTSNI